MTRRATAKARKDFRFSLLIAFICITATCIWSVGYNQSCASDYYASHTQNINNCDEIKALEFLDRLHLFHSLDAYEQLIKQTPPEKPKVVKQIESAFTRNSPGTGRQKLQCLKAYPKSGSKKAKHGARQHRHALSA